MKLNAFVATFCLIGCVFMPSCSLEPGDSNNLDDPKNIKPKPPLSLKERRQQSTRDEYTTKKNVKFNRVSDPKLGDFVWQDSRATGLVWGDDVGKETGTAGDMEFVNNGMSFEDAFAYCLNLNPENRRQDIKDRLLRDERPARGYFLPRQKEWFDLASILSEGGLMPDHSGNIIGYQMPEWLFWYYAENKKNGYEKQLRYWSSSIMAGKIEDRNFFVHIFAPETGNAFNSINTFIEGQNMSNEASVRCVRAGQPW